jgi:hypothetical protein
VSKLFVRGQRANKPGCIGAASGANKPGEGVAEESSLGYEAESSGLSVGEATAAPDIDGEGVSSTSCHGSGTSGSHSGS